MRRMKLLLASGIASAFVFLCSGFGPVVAFADEAVEGVETSEIVSAEEVVEETESVENTAVFEQKTYVYVEDNTKLELTLLSETNAVGEIYYYDTHTATLTFMCTYIESDVVELYLPDESYFDAFRLHPNGYLIKYDDGAYIPPDIDDEVVEEPTDETEIDFDDLLAFVGDLAEKEGFKDEWDKAMYYVETAASEKKVEVMIGLSIAVIVLFVTDRIVKIINYFKAKKYDTSKKDLKDILTSSGAQTDAINGLIDETANVGECAKSTETREKKIAEATKKQNTALRCLIRGTNIKQDLKDEALRNLNESDDLCDDAKK